MTDLVLSHIPGAPRRVRPRRIGVEEVAGPAPMISITIPGKPIAWARARSNGALRYTPEPQGSYATAVGTMARVAMSKAGYEPFEGPVEVIYRATFLWPAKMTEKRRPDHCWKTSKPDVDNLVKLCADAINGIVYRDDAQVVSLRAQKVFGHAEGAVLTVLSLIDADGKAEARQ